MTLIGREFSELSHFQLDRASIRTLSLRFCQKNVVVVLDRVTPDSQEPVVVGMLRVDDDTMIQHLQSQLHRTVEPVALNLFEIQRWNRPAGGGASGCRRPLCESPPTACWF